MTRHSHDEYRNAAGPGGRTPIPMGQTFRGFAQGTIISVDPQTSLATGVVTGYRFEVQTTEGKKLNIFGGRTIGDVVQKGQSYEFNYRVRKGGTGYIFAGRPNPVNLPRGLSYGQRNR